mgnify:CR=1 FL=1
MNNKLLIGSDLDGTLLTDNKKIRFKTKRYIHKLKKMGNIVVLATGRPVRTTIPFYESLKIDTPIICYNGAFCFNPHDKKFRPLSYPIPKSVIKKHYPYFKEKFSNAALCESLNHIYYEGEKEIFGFTLIRDKNSKEYMPKEISGPLEKTISESVYSFIMHSLRHDEEFKNEIISYVKNNMPGYIVDFWSENWYFEIRKEGVNKASTLRKLQKLYKIPNENVYTFGDSVNDIQLTNEFKHGYTMVNGKEYLKTNNVTKKDNNHNGVVYEIKQILKTKN